MLVCSSGGHLSQLCRLEAWWQRHERLWLTFDKADSRSPLDEERVVWAHDATTHNLPNLLRDFRLAWRTVARFAPNKVTGFVTFKTRSRWPRGPHQLSSR
jgi:hypothetical protein